MKYKVLSYGCKVNTYDTGLLQKQMNEAGFAENQDSPDVVLMNTCAVTHEATKESIRHLRKVKKEFPKAKVVMTGCAAQVDSEILMKTDADLIVANSHKGDLHNYVKKLIDGDLNQKLYRSNIFKKKDLEPGGGLESEHTRSFVKIQDGCNSFCTFCVIPFARGKSRSLSIQQIIMRINELTAKGINEVVLTGVHIGDYHDESSSCAGRLEDLVEAILSETKVPRIRLTSLEPIELSDRLLKLYKANGRLCPHFHMSIQSAHTKVLKDMKRNYSELDVIDSFHRIQEFLPGAFVGMDVIVGFPGESEEEFQRTYENLKNSPWSQIHVFPYSPRPGVYANRLEGQHHRSLIMDRAKKLRALGQERNKNHMQKQVGDIKEVLLLKKRSVIQSGLSRDYWNIYFDQPLDRQAGELVKVKVTDWSDGSLSASSGFLTGELI